jgi:esterase/lipase superfamily enzyme
LAKDSWNGVMLSGEISFSLAAKATVLALALGLAGCAGRPPGALTPVAAVDGTNKIDMLAVTTRKPTSEPGLMFGGERALAAHVARLTISIPDKREVGDIEWSRTSPPDPRVAFAATRAETLNPDAILPAFRELARGKPKPHVLVFVHGFNTRFDEAAFRFAQIVQDSGSSRQIVPVLFSWPSWGGLTTYAYDRESASVSRDALAQLLISLAKDPRVGEISVLAHSMGGWLAMEALRTVALRQGTIPPRITDVMLAAPDIDIDVAVTQARVVGTRHPRITLFTASDDQALRVSRLVWGSRQQLGAIDPTQEPARTNLARAGVIVYDLSNERSQDRLGHGRFAESPLAVQAIGSRLAAGNRLSASQDAAAEGVASLTRGAVGVIGDVVTAPISIVTGQPLLQGVQP